MMVDSGYTGHNFANEISCLTSAKVIVVKRNELHQFSVIPQRWLIERSFSWLGNYHRLWRNCERKLNTSLMMVSLAFIRLLLNANFPGFYNSNHTADRFSASRISFMHDFPETRGSQL